MAITTKGKEKGDNKAPGLQQKAAVMTQSAALADRKTAALDTIKASPDGKAGNVASAMKGQAAGASAPTSCKQVLWFSFYFDGTGNNLDADLGTQEHSNVARLFRAMPQDDESKGQYSIYVPGIGTYFAQIGDPGGTMRGMGLGAQGQDRLDWAQKEFDKRMAKHAARAANPTNAITEINVAAFGFSRGATEARAFIRDFIKNRCKSENNKLSLAKGGWPLRVRFMGLFDTVASVGLPMSTNNVDRVRNRRMTFGNAARLALSDGSDWLRAVDLAFGEPGADPSPGTFDGHASWADNLKIPSEVEQCVHFVAAHEIRNSFPVDSVFHHGQRLPNCREMLYPGVHSDVGGGYRPGEEGKSGTARKTGDKAVTSELLLSQIPLRAMYDLAIAAQVPLLAEPAWKEGNRSDFICSDELRKLFVYYLNMSGWGNIPMGQQMNKHMALYYAWRFAKIRRKKAGDKTEGNRISQAEGVFQQDKTRSQIDVGRLDMQKYLATGNSMSLQTQYDEAQSPSERDRIGQQIPAARAAEQQATDNYLAGKAKLDTMPSIGSLSKNMAELDDQLMADAGDIYQVCKKDPAKRRQLRPHYKVLLDAYENEFMRNQGLKDEKIFSFFEFHVHESLADFYKDSTLPSDPRVVYFGDDEKYKYAVNTPRDMEQEQTQAQAA